MQWTWDDLFLVVITKQGSLGVLSRLGEPLVPQAVRGTTDGSPGVPAPASAHISAVSIYNVIHICASNKRRPAQSVI